MAKGRFLHPMAFTNGILGPDLAGAVEDHLQSVPTGGDRSVTRRRFSRPATVANRILGPHLSNGIKENLNRRDEWIQIVP